MYKYLFGPVPSRRLGMSLGVDLVPHKVCSLNCIYCECGPTTKLTLDRKEYILYDKVIKELDHYFNNNPAPDYITFSRSGEPTLNSRIGDVLQFIKQKKPDVPVAVLTNGTLFYQKKVRTELLNADLVLPSLDAATDLIFRKINRPFHKFNVLAKILGLHINELNFFYFCTVAILTSFCVEFLTHFRLIYLGKYNHYVIINQL